MVEKITREEADRRIAELLKEVRDIWDAAEARAQEIAKTLGFAESQIAFEAQSVNGERTMLNAYGFRRRDPGGEWHLIEDDGQVDGAHWFALESALDELGTSLPPGDEGWVESADDLDLGDLETMLFADYDGDGNFQYDDKGMKTIIEDTWF